MTRTTAASRGVFGMRAPGAFSHVLGGVCPEGIVGTITDGIGAPVSRAVTASAVVPAAVPLFSVRERVNVVPALGQPLYGQAAIGHTAVRKPYNYMTLVIADGGDAAGPHRRRAPV